MPPLVIAGLVGLGAWLAYKAFKAEQARVRKASAHPRASKRPTRTLKQDPVTGIYKPDEDKS